MLPASVEHLTTLPSGRAAFGELLGCAVPDGWPEFPESIEFTLGQLTEHRHRAGWWMHFFLVDGGAVLRRLGFTRAAEIEDSDDGPLWRREVAVPAGAR